MSGAFFNGSKMSTTGKPSNVFWKVIEHNDVKINSMFKNSIQYFNLKNSTLLLGDFQVTIKNKNFGTKSRFLPQCVLKRGAGHRMSSLAKSKPPLNNFFFLAQMMGATFFPFFFSTFLISRKFVDMNENKTCFLFWPTLFIENLAIRVGFTALLIDHQQCWKSLMTARVI